MASEKSGRNNKNRPIIRPIPYRPIQVCSRAWKEVDVVHTLLCI